MRAVRLRVLGLAAGAALMVACASGSSQPTTVFQPAGTSSSLSATAATRLARPGPPSPRIYRVSARASVATRLSDDSGTLAHTSPAHVCPRSILVSQRSRPRRLILVNYADELL
jgi:hypothetical protein